MSQEFGSIVLAAYQPDPELFRRQLESLRAQTVDAWECVISVDGDPAPIRTLVAEITGDDPRFRVIGDGTRRGFFLNFEHGVRAVDPSARWIALSDQDDEWYPAKLATLLPHLAEVDLVSGQARLVEQPSGRVLGETSRADHGLVANVLNNQFSGSAFVFRSEILAKALPFPVASTRTAAHDHWLAVVAGAGRGTRMLPDVLQDYVQHSGNVFGDPSEMTGPVRPLQSIRTVLSLAQKYEGSRTPAALVRMVFWLNVGWRQLITDTLLARVGGTDAAAAELIPYFSAHRRFADLNRLLREAVANEEVVARFRVEYLASWFAGVLTRGRALVRRRVR
ncbi:glycosyltransferase [Microbacterium sp. C5A9]|uniref:glycosyltransferase n=1 Tax=Microbacterium sp. C5A9 TaxID=2736663 RepID=UPI001F52565F|nr:glycosyltransferase [Microbacterium sp. C5A9]MCI1017618.1 glycosyltransferase [Microbacterium sp. C5A9]